MQIPTHKPKKGRYQKILGVYPTKASAEDALDDYMKDHSENEYGKGDLRFGDSWNDEVSLFVMQAPLFL